MQSIRLRPSECSAFRSVMKQQNGKHLSFQGPKCNQLMQFELLAPMLAHATTRSYLAEVWSGEIRDPYKVLAYITLLACRAHSIFCILWHTHMHCICTWTELLVHVVGKWSCKYLKEASGHIKLRVTCDVHHSEPKSIMSVTNCCKLQG